jgi:hypothetical protein
MGIAKNKPEKYKFQLSNQESGLRVIQLQNRCSRFLKGYCKMLSIPVKPTFLEEKNIDNSFSFY